MQGNGTTKRGSTDPSFTQERKATETEWIKTLPTAYPYGMNDKVDDETTSNKDELTGSNSPLKGKYARPREN